MEPLKLFSVWDEEEVVIGQYQAANP